MLIIEGPNRRLRQPWVIYAIIVICSFSLLLTYDNVLPVAQEFGYKPTDFSFIRIFSALFLHANIYHLVGNLLYLYVFGDNVEDVFGPIRFILIYFLLGTSAHLLYHLFHIGSNTPAIGASGAISGLLGVYVVLFPTVRSLLFISGNGRSVTIPMPMMFSIGIWFILQLFMGLVVEIGGVSGVAYSAHIGGFLAGLLVGRIAKKRGLLDEHRLRLFRNRSYHRFSICPACYHETPTEKYGRYKCVACESEFLFDRTGIRLLMQ